MSVSHEKRITELEIQLAHTQHLLEQLNEVVTQQASKVDRMTRLMATMQENLDDLKYKTEEKRDLLDEKPPHY